MELKIHRAEPADYPAVRAFYHSLIEGMRSSEFDIGWKKDIYPSPEFLMESINAGELYIGMEETHIAAAMVLNHQCNEGYHAFAWPTEAADTEVTVIHALGVDPKSKGKGYGKQMVLKAFALARENRQKVIRLDVLAGNVPAERLYTGLGFRYLHTLQMFYEDTGWTDYRLYEYVL